MKKFFILLLVAITISPFNTQAQDLSAAPADDEALAFELHKFESAKLYAKKRVKFAKYKLAHSTEATGRVLTLIYTLSGDFTGLEVAENYKENLIGQGFKVHWEAEEPTGSQLCWSTLLEDVCYKNHYYGLTNKLQMKKTDESGDTYVDVIVGQSKDGFKGKPLDPTKKLPEMVLGAGDHVIIVRIVSPKEIKNQMIKENFTYILDQLKTEGKVALYGIYFDVDKADIKPESNQVLDEIAKALNQDTTLKLEIGGHTDSTGAEDHNIDLSLRRAAAVVAALSSKGIDGNRITAKGYGSSKPVASNDTEEGKAKNRRVELVKNS